MMRVNAITVSVMVIVLFGMAVVLVPVVTAAAAVPQSPTDVASTPAEESLEHEAYLPFQGERFDVFDWSLCKNLAKKHSGNILVSPISMKLALILLYEGSEGQTRHELAGALQLSDNQSLVRDRFSNILNSLQTKNPEYELDISTRLVVDKSIEPKQSYTATIKTFYSTDVSVANLTDSRNALKDINEWVSNVTHGNVKQVLTDEEKLKDSIFLVLNALFFKGTWRHPFSERSTRLGNFFTDVDKTVEVQYMNNVGKYYHAYSSNLDANILRIPYRGHKYSMFIILPEARTGLQHLLNEINPFTLRRHIQVMTEGPVDLSIPKFKIDFTSHLENSLRELGIRDMFESTASLIYIARAQKFGQRLQVSDFVQKSGLEVDENGTTAHAVTEVLIGNKISDTTFHVRHPFLFFIEDETTGTVLFVGKVTNPLESSGTIEEIPVTRIGDQPLASIPVAAAAAAAPAPTADFSDVTPVESTNAEDRFSFFDIELLQALASDGDHNVVVAPASVKAALTTLVEGAGGSTAQEILSSLRLPSDPAGLRIAAQRLLAPFKSPRIGAELDLATRVWSGNNVRINPRFGDILRQNYDSDIQNVNFADFIGSSNEINNWVSQKTKGHIQRVVEPGSVDPSTTLLLTNALYLKGNWKTSFDRDLTAIKCFRVPNYGCQDAYMMHSLGYYKYGYIPALNADVVQVPYTDPRLSMLIILPDRAEDGINQLVRDLNHVPISLMIAALEETEVLLALPRFSIESKIDLRSTLEFLKIRELFGMNANLSGIVNGPVQVGKVLHNAKVEVNEEGTIAAAVTTVAVVPLMGSTVQRVRADRPFIFMIRDSESGSILFAGRVTKPDPVPDQTSQRNSSQQDRRVYPKNVY